MGLEIGRGGRVSPKKITQFVKNYTVCELTGAASAAGAPTEKCGISTIFLSQPFLLQVPLQVLYDVLFTFASHQ